ncbi:hypothetical protein DPEC_G00307240 [Dallia pectoralis]|uniref:Uncharacterized protein n=1 Tax=Dallia pectoralis TaxID=75939 RepID=A0ACC2FEB6_DALPE|nr:hypothetical protein DPEC_G00307240 [Dallia pectoralis]
MAKAERGPASNAGRGAGEEEGSAPETENGAGAEKGEELEMTVATEYVTVGFALGFLLFRVGLGLLHNFMNGANMY